MSRTFYISDAHISHENVIKFDNRPFNSIEEMNQTIMNNWNETVKNDDVVYCLGDMHWGKADEVYEYFKQLNGKKICINGNHTLKNMPSKLKNLFADVKDYKEIKDNGRHVILSHYPIMCYKAAYNPNCWMLHGHTHVTREQELVEKWTRELIVDRTNPSRSCGHIMNVGCMMPWMGYKPRTLDEIIAAWKELYNTEEF